MVAQERWKAFSRAQQLLHIGSEIMRAKGWQGKNEENFHLTIQRAIALVDYCVVDTKWNARRDMLLGLRDELMQYDAGLKKNSITQLYNAL